jgi:hypothetical protein
MIVIYDPCYRLANLALAMIINYNSFTEHGTVVTIVNYDREPF